MNIPNPLHDWLRALPFPSREEHRAVGRLDLIGLDMAPTRRELSNQTWVPAIAAVVLAALLLAGLRMSIVRLRYAVAEGVTVEQQLLAEKRDMTVSLRQLREPKLVSERADALGFSAPDRVINLFVPSSSPVPGAVNHSTNAPDSAGAGSRP